VKTIITSRFYERLAKIRSHWRWVNLTHFKLQWDSRDDQAPIFDHTHTLARWIRVLWKYLLIAELKCLISSIRTRERERNTSYCMQLIRFVFPHSRASEQMGRWRGSLTPYYFCSIASKRVNYVETADVVVVAIKSSVIWILFIVYEHDLKMTSMRD
jgi:hypothetical protein